MRRSVINYSDTGHVETIIIFTFSNRNCNGTTTLSKNHLHRIVSRIIPGIVVSSTCARGTCKSVSRRMQDFWFSLTIVPNVNDIVRRLGRDFEFGQEFVFELGQFSSRQEVMDTFLL